MLMLSFEKFLCFSLTTTKCDKIGETDGQIPNKSTNKFEDKLLQFSKYFVYLFCKMKT